MQKYSLLLILTPWEIIMDSGGVLLLGPFRVPFESAGTPKKWSRALRPRLRYCLLNPIFILWAVLEEKTQKSTRFALSEGDNFLILKSNGTFNDRA